MLREKNHECMQFVLNGTFTWLQPFSLVSIPYIAFHLDRVYIDLMNMHRDKTISVFRHDIDELFNFFTIYYQWHYSFYISNKKIVCIAHDKMPSLRNANDVAFAMDLKI